MLTSSSGAKILGVFLRVVDHRELSFASDGELLRCHTLSHRIVDKVHAVFNKPFVRIQDILPGRKVIVGICPVKQLVEMNLLAHEGDSRKRVAMRAGERVLRRADVVVVKVGSSA